MPNNLYCSFPTINVTQKMRTCRTKQIVQKDGHFYSVFHEGGSEVAIFSPGTNDPVRERNVPY